MLERQQHEETHCDSNAANEDKVEDDEPNPNKLVLVEGRLKGVQWVEVGGQHCLPMTHVVTYPDVGKGKSQAAQSWMKHDRSPGNGPPPLSQKGCVHRGQRAESRTGKSITAGPMARARSPTTLTGPPAQVSRTDKKRHASRGQLLVETAWACATVRRIGPSHEETKKKKVTKEGRRENGTGRQGEPIAGCHE